MEYTVTIRAAEYRELVEKAATAELSINILRQELDQERSAKNKAWVESADMESELEKVQEELENVKASSDFWYKKACELGYGKANEEAE